jgi:preprotein translocase subunit YajC
MILMLGAFYALLIRPQRRQVAAHQQLLSTLEEGDEIITAGGIFGRIQTMNEDIVEVEVSPGTSLRVARTAITRKVG